MRRNFRDPYSTTPEQPQPPKEPTLNIKRIITLALAGVVGLMTLITGCSSIGTVPSGSVGVVTRFGATTGEIKEPGLFFITPFIEGVERMDTQTHAHKTQASAVTRDLQDVTTQVTLTYRLNSGGAARMYNSMRRDYEPRVLAPGVQEAIKAVTARYDAEELITKRAEVRTNIENMVRERLTKHDITLDQASITDFAFTADFTKAVEAKVVATQLAAKAVNDLVRIKTEAEQRVAEAEGEAKAIKIQAEAIQQQGGAAYVHLKAIEKWNGTLPQWMSGSGPLPFVNVDGK